MALNNHHGFLIPVSLFALVFSVFILDVVHSAKPQSSNGFRLKIMPRYSKQSPKSNNLTNVERYALFLQLSQKRALRLASESNFNITTHIIHPDMLTPKVGLALDSMYFVEISVGTPPTPYSLLLDTGSPLSWLQCAGCTICFGSLDEPFNYYLSNTFQFESCDHPLCIPRTCIEDKCKYEVTYGDGSSSTVGVLSRDNFNMYSMDNENEQVSEVRFGCGFQNRVSWGANDGPENEIGGIFGMGRGPQSFFSQIGLQRFSYCLNNWMQGVGTASILAFGNYASEFPAGSEIQSTPLIQGPVSALYYVNLLDISVGGVSLGIPRNFFGFRRDGTGGVILDTGSGVTQIFRPAFDLLMRRLEGFFASWHLQPFDATNVISNWKQLRYCYVRPNGFNYFPSVEFHFQGGAEFSPGPAGIYAIFDDFFCLQIFPTDGEISLIGSFIMADYYFFHDVEQGIVSFAQADCSLV